MANAEKLMPFILKWEGGFVDDPDDRGGATNKGVTISTFRNYFGNERTVEDLKNITDEQWLHIFKKGYWDKMKADEISDQSVANAIVDWAYNSGPKTAGKKVQEILGVDVDGIFGKKTIMAINDRNGKSLFNEIKDSRLSFVDGIVDRNPSQGKFLKGWRNRINGLSYEE